MVLFIVILVIYINIEIGKKSVRLAGDHLHGKLLFTWLSLVMSLMVSFCLSLFPQLVLDEIWDLMSQFLRVSPPAFSTRAYCKRSKLLSYFNPN